MKEKIKNILDKKIYSGVILAIITILSISYYIVKFVKEKEIIFSEKDFIIFLIFGFMIIAVSIMLIYVIFLVRKLKFDNEELHDKIDGIQKSLQLILHDTNLSEDNICRYLRVIEEAIMKINQTN